LVDVLMGLLIPTSGKMLVDGVSVFDGNQRAWQRHIAHVPQAIFLSDATIYENIAFGVERDKINHARAHWAAKQAQISKEIESMHNGYNTVVGEQGSKLSGGQKQRIGIARALYKNASVIVFDEATSALDGNTENLVMHAIKNIGSDITIIMVTHRPKTLSHCNKLIEVGRDLEVRHVKKHKDMLRE
jgi:ABC-type bacteriocin/lantibiotic exporter with double-glycine peptidase domain